MDRHEMADCLAGLMRELGWVAAEDETDGDDQEQEGETRRKRGQVTIVSHSKCVFENEISSRRGLTRLLSAGPMFTHGCLRRTHTWSAARALSTQ